MPTMSATSYTKYETGVKLYNSRREIEEAFDDPFDKYDDFYEVLTTMEKAIWFLLELGFSKKWVQEHFEFSRQAMSANMVKIRKKLAIFLEEKGNEV